MVEYRYFETFRYPARRRLVNRLAPKKQVTQAADVVSLEIRRILLFQDANRSRRRKHYRDLVIGDDLPPDARIGTNRQTFVQDARHAVDQRSIDDVRMPD